MGSVSGVWQIIFVCYRDVSQIFTDMFEMTKSNPENILAKRLLPPPILNCTAHYTLLKHFARIHEFSYSCHLQQDITLSRIVTIAA